MRYLWLRKYVFCSCTAKYYRENCKGLCNNYQERGGGGGSEKLELSSKNLDSTLPPKQKKISSNPPPPPHLCYVKNNVVVAHNFVMKPHIYGIQQIDSVDEETLLLFTSKTDKACLGDLFDSHCFMGEAEKQVHDFCFT